MKRGRLFSLAFGAAILIDAGPSLSAAPGYLPVNHERVVALRSDDVWMRLHAFLRDQGFAITVEDASAGTLDAVRSTPGKAGFSGVALCDARLFWRTAQARAALTVEVRPIADGTRVTVHAAFLDIGRVKKKGLPGYACTSTGVLETAVLDVASGQPMESAIIPR